VIVLDLMMPDLSGFEVLDRLKADDCTAGIPVIFAHPRFDSRDRDLLRMATAMFQKKANRKRLRMESRRSQNRRVPAHNETGEGSSSV
jgi:CheY-like chemotaxis protein